MKPIEIPNCELSENDHPVVIEFDKEMEIGYIDEPDLNDEKVKKVVCRHCHSLELNEPHYRSWDNTLVGYLPTYKIPRALVSGGCEYEEYTIICLDCLLEGLAANNISGI